MSPKIVAAKFRQIASHAATAADGAADGLVDVSELLHIVILCTTQAEMVETGLLTENTK